MKRKQYRRIAQARWVVAAGSDPVGEDGGSVTAGEQGGGDGTGVGGEGRV